MILATPDIPTWQVTRTEALMATGQSRKRLNALASIGKLEIIDDEEAEYDASLPVHPCAQSLAAFVEETTNYTLEGWQRIICDRLERLREEKGARLLIHGPPQFGKSVIISQRFPCWLLGNIPDIRMRLCCYNQTHAERFTRTNLQIMRQEIYELIFPNPAVRLPPICAGGEFSTLARANLLDANPSVKALGMNSGFVGLGVDLLIVDDPYKGRDEAFSQVVNDGVWNWWKDDVQSRLNPETNVVVMFHRWKEDDLAGRLIEQGGWEILRFPALADGGENDPTEREEGETLSDRYPEEYLESLRETMGQEMFVALYGGAPVAEGGNHFKVGRLGHAAYYADSDELPMLTLYQGWDLAISLKKKADYTVCATIGVDADQNVYILDIMRERIDFNATMEGIQEQYDKWSSNKDVDFSSIAIETTGYQASAFEEASRRYFIPIQEVNPSKDKLVRSQLLADRVKMGKVYVNKYASWWPELEKELLSFPNGKHDDQVDAIVHALELRPSGEAETQEVRPQKGSLREMEVEMERRAAMLAKTKLDR